MGGEIFQLLVYGIVLGSVITLGAIGVSLVFGILRFAHFAHGDVMTWGAFCAFVGVSTFGMPLWMAFPLALVGAAVMGVVIDQVFYRRLRKYSPITLLIGSVGIALILRNVIQMIFGTQNRVYVSGIQVPMDFFGVNIRPDQLYIVVGSALLVTALHIFLQYTRTGKAMRAMSDNPSLARVTGISTERVIIWMWIIAGVLAGAAGVFLGMDTRLQATMGWNMLLPIFAACILGGIGKPYGAIAGGMVIGIAQEMSTLVVSSAYKPAVAFGILIVMLIVRPTGLFRGK